MLNPGCIYIGHDSAIRIDDFCYYWLARHLHELEDAEAFYLSYHIAPEIYQGGEIDGRADIYSLGIVFLQLLTDYVPFYYFDQTTIPNRRLNLSVVALRKLLPHYPPQVERILAHCLQKNPENRYHSLKELETDIHELRGESSSPQKGREGRVVSIKSERQP